MSSWWWVAMSTQHAYQTGRSLCYCSYFLPRNTHDAFKRIIFSKKQAAKCKISQRILTKLNCLPGAISWKIASVFQVKNSRLTFFNLPNVNSFQISRWGKQKTYKQETHHGFKLKPDGVSIFTCFQIRIKLGCTNFKEGLLFWDLLHRLVKIMPRGCKACTREKVCGSIMIKWEFVSFISCRLFRGLALANSQAIKMSFLIEKILASVINSHDIVKWRPPVQIWRHKSENF